MGNIDLQGVIHQIFLAGLEMIVFSILLEPLLKKTYAKYKRTIQGTIKKSNNLNDFGKSFFQYIRVYIPIILYLLTMEIIVILLDKEYSQMVYYAYGIISFTIITLILASLSKFSKLSKIISEVFLAMLCEMYLLALIIQSATNENLLFIVIGGMTIAMFLLIELIFYINDVYDFYRRSSNFIIIIIRNLAIVCLIIYMSYAGIFKKYTELSKILEKFIMAWVITYLCERLFFLLNNKSNVQFLIKMKSGNVITDNKISQYKNDKVKYIMQDGNVHIVEAEEIMSIEYSFPMDIMDMKNGKCLLYDVTEFYFLLYKYINDSWVRFVIVEGNERKFKIINSQLIKEMTVTKWYKDKESIKRNVQFFVKLLLD